MAGWWVWALAGVAAYEVPIHVREYNERVRWWQWASRWCDQVGKPLLRIGVRRSPFEPPNGDVTVDIDPIVEQVPGGILADERSMPFGDKEFGVCFNEHTLEHLREPEDVVLAVRECIRVADYAVFLCPSPYSLWANLFNPTHNLRLWFDPDAGEIIVTRNRWRTGLGFVYPEVAPEFQGDAPPQRGVRYVTGRPGWGNSQEAPKRVLPKQVIFTDGGPVRVVVR